MKKLIAAVLLLAVCFALCSCGKKVSGSFSMEGDETLSTEEIMDAVKQDMENNK